MKWNLKTLPVLAGDSWSLKSDFFFVGGGGQSEPEAQSSMGVHFLLAPWPYLLFLCVVIVAQCILFVQQWLLPPLSGVYVFLLAVMSHCSQKMMCKVLLKQQWWCWYIHLLFCWDFFTSLAQVRLNFSICFFLFSTEQALLEVYEHKVDLWNYIQSLVSK